MAAPSNSDFLLHPARQAAKLRSRLKRLAENLQTRRTAVALREGQFKLLRAMTLGRPDIESKMRHAASLLHLRQYEGATAKFKELWKDQIARIPNDQTKPRPNTVQIWDAPADAFSESLKCAPHPESYARRLRNLAGAKEYLAIPLVRLARWGLYLHLVRSQAQWVEAASERIYSKDSEKDENCKQACAKRLAAMHSAKWFCLFGTELVRRCHDIADGHVFDENILLRAHGALVLGILKSQERAGAKRAEDAWRVLGDADSFLGGFPVADGGVTSAIVDLRAAELCLLEVANDKQFANTRRALRLLPHFKHLADDPLYPRSPADIRNSIWQASNAAAISLSQAECETLAVKISEAINWLDRAETVLTRHPKSRWWWSIFAVLKTKACEYLHCLRLARAVAANKGQGLQPRILLPSAFIFLDSGLLRLVGEKDFEDIFFLSRALSSLVEILRCESYYATLYVSNNPDVRTHERQRQFSKPLLESRLRLIKRLRDKLQTACDASGEDSDPKKSASPVSTEVQRYANHCLEKAAEAME